MSLMDHNFLNGWKILIQTLITLHCAQGMAASRIAVQLRKTIKLYLPSCYHFWTIKPCTLAANYIERIGKLPETVENLLKNRAWCCSVHFNPTQHLILIQNENHISTLQSSDFDSLTQSFSFSLLAKPLLLI